MQPPTAPAHPAAGARRPDKPAGMLHDVVRLAAVAVLLALVVRGLLLQVFWIPSGSMEPTLLEDDRVVVLKPAGIDRGDVIVFKPPPSVPADEDTNEHLIKRAIGMGGDVIQIVDGVVTVNGNQLHEPYARPSHMNMPATTVPAGHVFYLGDNRGKSQDSSFHGRTVPLTHVLGEAVLVIWPLHRLDPKLAASQS